MIQRVTVSLQSRCIAFHKRPIWLHGWISAGQGKCQKAGQRFYEIQLGSPRCRPRSGARLVTAVSII